MCDMHVILQRPSKRTFDLHLWEAPVVLILTRSTTQYTMVVANTLKDPQEHTNPPRTAAGCVIVLKKAL